jgi:SPP1 gp7 family putative phage head morphogenesis protein
MADGSREYPGVLARTIAMVRYAATGKTPEWFGPLTPIQPMAPPEVAGRQFDYPVGFNINFTPRGTEPVGFKKLKALAANSDLLKMIMAGQMDKAETLEWAIKPKEKAGHKRGAVDQSILDIQAKLEYPDGIHDWAQWLRILLEQLFVLDAVSIYRRRTLGGSPYTFEILDGATIKPLIDQSGRRPAFPDPAYQQVLKGVPAADYTTRELLYYPQNPRADHVYGFSRVEMIITTVETAIERMKGQKAFFTHGNLADGFFSAPDGVQPDQVRQVEQMWNNLITAGVENRRIAQFLPAGFQWNPIGAPPLQDVFDEWLTRLICFVFSTSPTPFLKQQGLGHGSSQTDHAAAEAAGLANIMQYVRRLMNRLLAEDFGRPDLEFTWIEDREFDPKTKAEIEDKRLRNGSLLLDEVRDRNGEDPLPDGLGAKPLIYTAAGAQLLDAVINPPEPQTVVAAPVDPNAKTTPEPMTKAAPALERKLAKAITSFLATKGDEIAKQFGDALGLEKAAPPMDEGFHSRVDDAFDEVDWDWTPLAKVVEPTLTGIAVAAGKDAVSELGLFDKDVLAKMTVGATTYAESRAAEMVGRKLVDGELVENEGWSIPSATRDMLRSTVTQAMESGASNDELAKAIRESDAFSKERATTIARTETAKADTQGARAGWKASGEVAGRQWNASPNCCDECQDMDGQIVGIDEEFEGGDVPLHPNCECFETPVLNDEMPDQGDDEDN